MSKHPDKANESPSERHKRLEATKAQMAEPIESLSHVQSLVDAAQFAESPVTILDRFLEEYIRDPNDIPRHIIDALSERIVDFFANTTLDAAFGGQTQRQLQAIMRARDVDDTVFTYVFERKHDPKKRSEDVIDEIAEGLEESDETVRKRLREGGPRGRRKQSKPVL